MVIIWMIKNMEKEYFNGQMAVNTWDFGVKADKMEQEFIHLQIKRKNMVNGKMGKGLNGSQKKKLSN